MLLERAAPNSGFKIGNSMESVNKKTITKAGDRIFRSLSTGSGVLILLTLATVSGFLILQSIPAFTGAPEAAQGDLVGYLLPLVFGTI